MCKKNLTFITKYNLNLKIIKNTMYEKLFVNTKSKKKKKIERSVQAQWNLGGC